METSEVSEKFVPLPKRDNLLGDLLVGLKRFRNVAMRKELFLNQGSQQKEKEEKRNISKRKTTGNAISSNIERILKYLKNSRAVIIPTDKTNNF